MVSNCGCSCKCHRNCSHLWSTDIPVPCHVRCPTRHRRPCPGWVWCVWQVSTCLCPCRVRYLCQCRCFIGSHGDCGCCNAYYGHCSVNLFYVCTKYISLWFVTHFKHCTSLVLLFSLPNSTSPLLLAHYHFTIYLTLLNLQNKEGE